MTVARIRPRRRERGGDGHAQGLDIVPGHLQGPVRAEPHRVVAGHRVDHDAVAVLVHGGAEFPAVGYPHDDSARGQGSVIDADDDRVRPGVAHLTTPAQRPDRQNRCRSENAMICRREGTNAGPLPPFMELSFK